MQSSQEKIIQKREREGKSCESLFWLCTDIWQRRGKQAAGSSQLVHTAGGSDEMMVIAKKCFADFWWQARARHDSPADSSTPMLTVPLPSREQGLGLGMYSSERWGWGGALGSRGSCSASIN